MQRQALMTSPHHELPSIDSPPLVPTIDCASDIRRLPVPQTELHTSLRNLPRLLNDLMPFYGPASPTAVFDVDGRVEVEAMRGSLSAVRAWVSSETGDRPLVLMVG